jgi:hypothetical protein
MLSCALWLGAWLRGTAAPDDLLEALARLAPGASPAGVLAEVRSARPVGTWLLLPRPGRILGWPQSAAGPPEPAVLLTDGADAGWLIRPSHGRWSVGLVGPAEVAPLRAEALSGRQGRRAFDSVVEESAARFERLGLDRPAAMATPHRWAEAVESLPPGLEPDALAVLHRGTALLDVLQVALADDGAAVTSAEAAARAAEVRQLVGRVEDVLAGVVGGLNAPTDTVTA